VIVARMVIAASITALLIETFQIPGGAIGVLSAFLLSRESLQSTTQSALALGGPSSLAASSFLLGHGSLLRFPSRTFCGRESAYS
jgi:multidrug resistance protein MdtO